MNRFVARVFKLSRLMGQAGYRRGLRFGVAAAIEHAELIALLPIGTLVDVGANVGQFSLLVEAHHPQALIHAFEPLQEAAKVFTRLFGGRSKVTLHRFAAGAAASKMEINVSGHADSSSLLPISRAQAASWPGTEAVGTRQVQVRRVDDVLNQDLPGPLLIKLDVQGYELEALKGMPSLLAKADYVYVEVSFAPLYDGQPLAAEVIAWLTQRGFEVGGVQHIGRIASGAPIQADILFCRAGAAPPLLPPGLAEVKAR